MKSIAAAVLFALLYTSCGAEEPEPGTDKPQQELNLSTPEKAFDVFRVAQEKGDWKSHYQVLSPEMRKVALFERVFALEMRPEDEGPKRILAKYVDKEKAEKNLQAITRESSYEDRMNGYLSGVEDQEGMYMEASKYFHDRREDKDPPKYEGFKIVQSSDKVAAATAKVTHIVVSYRQYDENEPVKQKDPVTSTTTMYFILHEGEWRLGTPTEFEEGGGKLEAPELPSPPNVRSPGP